MFYDPSAVNFVKEKIKNSLTIHFWNKMTKQTMIIPAKNHPYAVIAKVYCPKVFGTVNNYF